MRIQKLSTRFVADRNKCLDALPVKTLRDSYVLMAYQFTWIGGPFLPYQSTDSELHLDVSDEQNPNIEDLLSSLRFVYSLSLHD
jgi:hypothetical protein